MLRTRILLCVLLLTIFPASALERPEVTFKVFQFPPNMIPRIDGNDDDWAMVPDSYAIGMDQLVDTEAPAGTVTPRDPKKLDVKVKVGWVKGLNRLYFLYEAYKDYWDFSRPGLHNDIFEVVVDGDLSGGPLIDKYHRDVWTQQAVGDMSKLDPRISSSDAYFAQQGVHAQNYHIFTPALDKDWTMAWGCAQYIKELPYANHAIKYNFKPGEPGKLVLEFWITPFDYAGCEGPQRAVGVRADGEQDHRPLLGRHRLPRSQLQRAPVLEPLAQADLLRQRVRAGRLPPDAAGAAVPQAHRRASGRSRSSTWTAVWSPSRTSPRARSPAGSGTSAMARPRPSRTRSINTRTGRARRGSIPSSWK